MKGKRKKMRKMIREALPHRSRPWLEVVGELQAKGIPLNLILSEANAYGLERISRHNSQDQESRQGSAESTCS